MFNSNQIALKQGGGSCCGRALAMKAGRWGRKHGDFTPPGLCGRLFFGGFSRVWLFTTTGALAGGAGQFPISEMPSHHGPKTKGGPRCDEAHRQATRRLAAHWHRLTHVLEPPLAMMQQEGTPRRQNPRSCNV